MKYFSGYSFVGCGLALMILACGGNEVSGPTEGAASFSYQAVTPEDIEATRLALEQRNTSPEAIQLVEQDFFRSDAVDNQEIRIYQYQIDGVVRYGSVFLPPNYQGQSLPVVIMLEGLDQSNRELPVRGTLNFYQYYASQLGEFIAINPIFRGSFHQSSVRYESEGNFCDAYDGAADDAIALLNIVAQEIPEADTDTVLAVGGSRGGNVALLLGQRETRVKMSIDLAGPVDFYRQSVASHYQEQYQCQFFDGFNAQSAKMKMLASSPLHFVDRSPITRIHHAEKDSVVPIWNAMEMNNALVEAEKDVVLYSYSRGSHTNFASNNQAFADNLSADVSQFMQLWSESQLNKKETD